ncbi:etoposide-induced protein 2.4 homolog [Tribolium castaneum]|uniref:Etoposide-induced protein 2.4 homolog-like Protein n=1 Tax=Tribolium castaneum TaxID=7070 RepID=D2A132_TRICA|nr:PREDICTED: etoposide-induced protein 2.4 homolog [Tribolium castaneum]XP_008192642.1 PREDICTED: etoposide-induced protein 2.4 homolog [Tribolium castaneum]XP_974537.1 PREDICTED: etoposide-induced protein 2.4 homolog [Tribolium castaneum]EFA02598.1 Etoposide-induced protein 2.4 homolog-like Protein [Tribolium castaneum]|eukprot:XP_008192641.1 PREDICTED: etoposide-induced protein 2.4 homolog [Tribolium castaneum]
MDVAKGFGSAVFWGVCDSFKGFYIIFRLDKELNKRRLSRLSPTHSSSPIRRRQSESREQTPNRTLPKHEQSTVMSRVFQCGLLNGAIFLLSILLFDYAFLPSMKKVIFLIFGKDSRNAHAVWFWAELVLSFTFQTIWVVPLFAISKFINNLWFQDIGQSAYKYSRGRSNASLSLSKTVADFIFSTVVESFFLIQALAMTYSPLYYLGYSLYLIHLCLLYSLYAFEYKWGEMGWEIHKRLTCIETHWPYFIGFGLPLVLLTQVSNSWIINGCIFSMLFPLYIISANEANPVVESCSRIKIFSPVIALSNTLFSLIGKEKKLPVGRPAAPRR